MIEKLYRNGFLIIGLMFSTYHIFITLYPSIITTNTSIEFVNIEKIIFNLTYGILIFLNLFLIKKAEDKQGILRVFVIFLCVVILVKVFIYLQIILRGSAYADINDSDFFYTVFGLGVFSNFKSFFLELILILIVNIYAVLSLFGFYKRNERINFRIMVAVVKRLIPITIVILWLFSYIL